MILAIPKYFGHILLFLLAVVVSYSVNFEFQFAIWAIIAGFYALGVYSKSFLIFLGCFVSILILGSVRSLFYDYPFYIMARDITYFLKPILGLIIGYQAFKGKNIKFLNVVVYISLFLAVGHLLILLYNAIFHSLANIEVIRAVGGYFSDFEVFGIVLLLFNKKFDLNFSKKRRNSLLIVISISVFLYFARTNMIQLLILCLGMLGFFTLNLRNFIIFSMVAGMGYVGYMAISDMNPKRRSDGIEGFLYKIKIAPYEIYDPYVKNDNTPRFHDRFRSYETKVTILQMRNRNDAGIWLGNGFGSMVNYGTKVYTTDGNVVQYAPILHNGYTTVFLKTGLVGIFIFVFSLLYLSFYGRSSTNKHAQNVRLLINSTGVFMFLSTLVFLGFYLKLDNKSLILGGLIAYYEGILRYKKMPIELEEV